MTKMDLTQHYRHYYTASATPQLMESEKASYISITGKGDPSSPLFATHIAALYAIAYKIKFACKNREQDFTVAKLEGLWWYDENQYPNLTIATATAVPRSEWAYRLLIRLPEYVSSADIHTARDTVLSEKKLPCVADVSFFEMTEGTCVQMLHIGPFATETASLQQMSTFMSVHNLERNGPHHEIYLSDFRRTAPEKLRTLLREPVRQRGTGDHTSSNSNS